MLAHRVVCARGGRAARCAGDSGCPKPRQFVFSVSVPFRVLREFREAANARGAQPLPQAFRVRCVCVLSFIHGIANARLLKLDAAEHPA